MRTTAFNRAILARLLTAAALVVSFASHAKATSLPTLEENRWNRDNVLRGSLLNRPQMAHIERVMYDWKTTRANNLRMSLGRYISFAESDRQETKVLASAYNHIFRQWSLPLLDLEDPLLRFSITQAIGFASSETVGFNIKDRYRNYCLPCDVSRNHFVWGLSVVGPAQQADPSQTAPR